MSIDTNMSKIGLAAGMIKNFPQMDHGQELFGLTSHITFGSFTLKPRTGNPEPTYWFNPKTNTSINAVGLTNQGLATFLREDLPTITRLLDMTSNSTARIRVSLVELQKGDLVKMCDMLNNSELSHHISEVEVNAACPNHRSMNGLHPVLAHDSNALYMLMKETETLGIPKAIKIAPEMTEEMLDNVIKFCLQHGFYTIVSANTLLGSSSPDGTQRLSVDKGGQAGAILQDIGVKQVAFLSPQCKENGIKLYGCGGVLSAEVHRAYTEAGADETQIATGFMEYGSKIFQDIHIALAEED